MVFGFSAAVLGIIGVLLILAGVLIYSFLIDPPIADWLEATPWGNAPFDSGEFEGAKHWVVNEPNGVLKSINYEKILLDLKAMLITPKLRLGYEMSKEFNMLPKGAVDLTTRREWVELDLSLPGFVAGTSEVDVQLWYRKRTETGTFDYIARGFSEEDAPWHRLDIDDGDTAGNNGEPVEVSTFRHRFWQEKAELLVKPNIQGWLMRVPFSLFETFRTSPDDEFDIKVLCCYYPNGKAQQVVISGNIPYSLPLPDSDNDNLETINNRAYLKQILRDVRYKETTSQAYDGDE
ncbi:hypothetical protein [Pleionea mediterranea]|uniref:Uncharacterized protein n=1 Tax=Pleionea mediterranea TaxID=523701 RepID=A0A316F5X6_9GAMM|nr:hypothetical protein [Pleionea mediterranea]PWK41525.1 hypothetical protein C8D97_1228 [Pleionea mediterranea]